MPCNRRTTHAKILSDVTRSGNQHFVTLSDMSDNASDSGGVSRIIIGPGRSDQILYVSFMKLLLSDEANNVDDSAQRRGDLSDGSGNRKTCCTGYRTYDGKKTSE